MSTIFIDHKNKVFQLSFSPAPERLKKIKEYLPLRTYNSIEKVWEVPELAVKTIDVLNEHFSIEYTHKASNRRDFINQSIERLVDYKLQEDNWEDFQGSGPMLRMYQKQGVNFLVMAKRALLADDMGLGKTIQSIKAILELGTKKNLIVCPATLQWNWYYELERHFGITAKVIQGTLKKRREQWLNYSDGFYIISYDLLRHDIEHIPLSWDSIIADEAVYLKNYNAKRTKAAMRLKSNVKIALSGMPIETKLEDFFSIFKWVRPELTIHRKDNRNNDVSVYSFQKRYCVKNEFTKQIIGYKNLEELHTYTSPFILRREKNKVLTELPDKWYTDNVLILDSKERQAYRHIANQAVQWLQEQTGNVWQNTGNMSKLQSLMQFVENPAGVGFDKLQNIKLEWLKETYDNYNDKIVVFVNYLSTVDLLRKEFQTHYVIKGDVDNKLRVELVDEFNAAKRGIFILTDAGRFGLNITGANVIVNYGYNFNPASIEQRENRLHRFGQQNKVHVLNPFIKDTIDEKIMNVARKRLKESQQFMENSDTVSRSFSSIDIMDMICADF